MNKILNSIKENKISNIIILILLSLIFYLFNYNFNLILAITSTLTLFIFATFISFMYTQFLKLYKETFFEYWWWRFYLIMFLGGILSKIVFGDL